MFSIFFLLSKTKCLIRKITVKAIVVSSYVESSQWKLLRKTLEFSKRFPSPPHSRTFISLSQSIRSIWHDFSYILWLLKSKPCNRTSCICCDFLAKDFIQQWEVRCILGTFLQRAKVFLKLINLSDNVGHLSWCYQPYSQYF